jgi:hypothetical protein
MISKKNIIAYLAGDISPDVGRFFSSGCGAAWR